MTAGEQADQQAVNQMLLADDDPGHLLAEQAQPGRTHLYRFIDGLDGGEDIGILRDQVGRRRGRGRCDGCIEHWGSFFWVQGLVTFL